MPAPLARIAILAALSLAGVAGVALGTASGAPQGRFAYSFELSGEISPATSDWAGHALEEAADERPKWRSSGSTPRAAWWTRCARSSATSSPRRCRCSSTSAPTGQGRPPPGFT